MTIRTETEISLARLTTDKFVNAGLLRAKVSPFECHGQTFTNLDLLCYLQTN